MFAPVVPYSSEVQQPMHATAALGKHPHTHWTAQSNSDQGCAGSSHRGGQAALATFWPYKDAQRCRLVRTSEYRLGRSALE